MSKTREPTYLEVMEIMTKNQMGAAEKLLDKAVDEYLVAETPPPRQRPFWQKSQSRMMAYRLSTGL